MSSADPGATEDSTVGEKLPVSVERRSRWSWLWSTSTILSAIASLLTMAGLVVAIFIDQREKVVAGYRVMEAMHQQQSAERALQELENARRQLARLQEVNDALRRTIDGQKKGGTETRYAALSPPDRQTLDRIRDDQTGLQTRLSALEATLVTSPEKALALPMLKQQVDTLQDRTRGDLDSVRGEIGRLFTLTQWFIGLIFTIALGVFGLALGNFKRSSEKHMPER